MSWFVYVIRLADRYNQNDRNAVLEHLRAEGIGCNNYFSPIHLQPYLTEQLGCKRGDFPVTEYVADRTIAIPFHNNITEEQARRVCAVLRQALDQL